MGKIFTMKISTLKFVEKNLLEVGFCPRWAFVRGGLLSGGLLSSGLLSGGLMSGGLMSSGLMSGYRF